VCVGGKWIVCGVFWVCVRLKGERIGLDSGVSAGRLHHFQHGDRFHECRPYRHHQPVDPTITIAIRTRSRPSTSRSTIRRTPTA
jgi:hypothetical protein